MTARSAINAAWALLLVCTTHHASAGEPLDRKFLLGFMSGEYALIGRKPDSTATYTGRVTLREESDTLLVTRIIDGRTSTGSLRFETIAGTDRIPVARMQFTLDGVVYEATYMWSSDADNYPRFTGYVYRPGNRTKSPGLEALFPIHK
ncbi:MAG: hypothetical protein ACM3KL_02280 [Alphaproteobacteria bacterium]